MWLLDTRTLSELFYDPVSDLGEALALVTTHLDAVKPEPRSDEARTTSDGEQAIDGVRFGTLTNRAIPFHEKFFFLRVFFFAPAESVDAMMGGPSAPGTNAEGAEE